MTTVDPFYAQVQAELKQVQKTGGTPTQRVVKTSRTITDEIKNEIIKTAFTETYNRLKAAEVPIPDNLQEQHDFVLAAATPGIIFKLLLKKYSEADIRVNLGYAKFSNADWKNVFTPGLDLFKKRIALEVTGLKVPPDAERYGVSDGKRIDFWQARVDAVTKALFAKSPDEKVIYKTRGKGNSHYEGRILAGATVTEEQWEKMRSVAAEKMIPVGLHVRNTSGKTQQAKVSDVMRAQLMLAGIQPVE